MKVSSAISNLGVVLAGDFSNMPFATYLQRVGVSSKLKKKLVVVFCLILSNSVWAIALTNAGESIRASIVRFFSKSKSLHDLSPWRFRTNAEENGRYHSSVCSSSLTFVRSVGLILWEGKICHLQLEQLFRGYQFRQFWFNDSGSCWVSVRVRSKFEFLRFVP